MASHGGRDVSDPAIRLSPGDAVFRRLRERETSGVKKQVRQSGIAKSAARLPEPRSPEAADTSPDLEAVLRNQLDSISAALDPAAPPPDPKPQPAASIFAPRSSGPGLPPAAGLKLPDRDSSGRSVFAPDPVRQRDYVDLRHSSDRGGRAPARKVAAKASQTGDAGRVGSGLPPVDTVLWDDDPAGFEPPVRDNGRNDETLGPGIRSRGLDARTLSIAALVGVGLGFGGLTLMSQFTAPPDTSSVLAGSGVPLDRIVTNAVQPSSPSVAVSAAVPAPKPVKTQERLLADIEPRGPLENEGRTQAMMIEDSPADSPVVAEARPSAPVSPPRAADRPTTVEDLGTDSPWINHDFGPRPNVLAYAPTPERNAAPRTRSPESGPAENRGPGVAKVSLDVNIRSAPDNDAPVVLVAKSGTTLKIEKCLFWCTVEVDGQRGYIYRKFVGR